MIQKKLSNENPHPKNKENRWNLTKIDSVSEYQNLHEIHKTPEKVSNNGSKNLERSQSGIGLSEYSNFKKRTCSKSSIPSHPEYVDYSEIISDWEIKTPVKIANKRSKNKETSARRTRAMRSHVVSKEPRELKDKRFAQNSSFIGNSRTKNPERRKKNNSSFLSYHPRNKEKRANTPLLNKVPKKSLKSMKPKKTENAYNMNNLSFCGKSNPDLSKRDNCSDRKLRNLRLELHQAGRNVSLKHLNYLWSRPTPEIKKVVQIFCMLINIFKQKERRIKPSTLTNWSCLWKYISKHNCSITSEVISAANNIEKGEFDAELMEETIKEFEFLKFKGKIDSSWKIIYEFIKISIEFYDSKQKRGKDIDNRCYSSVTEIKPNV